MPQMDPKNDVYPAEFDALFGDYTLDHAYDEMREAAGELRPHYCALAETLAGLPAGELERRKQSADLSFLTQGITFTVYGRDEGTERIFPHDLLPRLITGAEWDRIKRGLTQRITALNLFLRDVETFLLAEEKERKHVLANLDKLVVKAVGESGGYGMLIGPQSTAKQREEFARQIEANPRNYIAQPTLDFSRAPCLIGDRLEPRHVDLQPYVLFGDKINIVPGGPIRHNCSPKRAG